MIDNLNIWWVNQGATYRLSKAGGFLWAPERNSKGAELTYWSTMKEVRAGDIIVHCSGGKIVALGRAISSAYLFNRPSGFQAPAWIDNSGRRVDVEYFELIPPVFVSEVAESIQALHIYQGPLNKNGQPKQSYLHRFSTQGLRLLKRKSAKWPEWAVGAINEGAE